MPSFSGFQSDLFISYAHADNESASESDRWVSRFVADLDRSLTRRLGESPTIYFDLRKLSSGDELAGLLEHARSSAVFVAIVSPSYVKRKWTREELEAFLSDDQKHPHLCPVEVLPVDPGDDYPRELTLVKRAQFWHCPGDAQTARTVQATIDKDKYYGLVEDITEELKRRLKLFDCRRLGEREPISALKPPAAGRIGSIGGNRRRRPRKIQRRLVGKWLPEEPSRRIARDAGARYPDPHRDRP